MKRKDLLLLAGLILLWLAWPAIDRHIIRPTFFPQHVPTDREAPAEALPPPAPVPAPLPETGPHAVEEPPAPAVPPPAAVAATEEEQAAPEERVHLENDVLHIVLSTHGGGVVGATLKEYRTSIEEDSDPVVFDFSGRPALVYEDAPGLGRRSAYVLRHADTRRALFEHRPGPGLLLEREVRLGDNYEVRVSDRFTLAEGYDPRPLDGAIRLAKMPAMDDGTAMRGVAYLGVDTLSPGGEKVRHLGRRIPRMFRDVSGNGRLPVELQHRPHDLPVEWIAAKNKYFVQILAPEGGGEWVEVEARREILPREQEDPAFIARMQPLEWVSARLGVPSVMGLPGESVERNYSYYVGPKKYAALADLGMRRGDVMEFGFWAPVGKLLLRVLNALQAAIWPHNYGLAIILLTGLIRIVFWPITHKSTQSMRKMQSIQPLLKEINVKYKDDAQKKQQAMMALYKEHKVNPLGGCLPMLVQIPVFIALFVVLRSAIELRFASFLWIRDLSEPENLLADVLPYPLNILPLLMAATMFWQQKLTPSGGDSQQQKIMAFMPVMMLVFFYTMPSGLVLYWTTSQCLMIAQQLLMRREKSRGKAPARSSAPKRPAGVKRPGRKR